MGLGPAVSNFLFVVDKAFDRRILQTTQAGTQLVKIIKLDTEPMRILDTEGGLYHSDDNVLVNNFFLQLKIVI